MSTTQTLIAKYDKADPALFSLAVNEVNIIFTLLIKSLFHFLSFPFAILTDCLFSFLFLILFFFFFFFFLQLAKETTTSNQNRLPSEIRFQSKANLKAPLSLTFFPEGCVSLSLPLSCCNIPLLNLCATF